MKKALLIAVFCVVVLAGWKYPLLGYVASAVMLAGLAGGFIGGRYVCGNICPRGAFLDKAGALVSPRKPLPDIAADMRLRWGIFALLMGFMAFRLWQGPLTVRHTGLIFWQMCVITSAIALVLAAAWRPRTWCALCPMGTVQRAAGGGSRVPQIDKAACVSCGLCEKACPLELPLVSVPGKRSMKDCIQCGACAKSCPRGSVRDFC
ncbi:MAG: 4Fe-4S binding protein [Elusimicrobiales bacterium]